MLPPWRRSGPQVEIDVPYVPTDDDLRLEQTPEVPGPVLRAAKNPNSKILASLLNDGRFSVNDSINGPLHMQWASALTQSVLHALPENTDLLLEHGADPNGFLRISFSIYSSNFIRHRPTRLTHTMPVGPPPREQVLAGIEESQTGPITIDEIVSRFTTRARFWAEIDYPSTTFPLYVRPPMTAMETAAKIGDLHTLDRLLAAGADTTAWKIQLSSIPVDATASSLSVSSPLHQAVESENLSTVEYLLLYGHRPDIFPLAPITRSVNAAMYTVAKNPPWLPGLEAIAPHADFSLRTPIYNCHILHLATAQLDLSLLESVASITRAPLSTLAPTALGHTLLHIACLPLDETHINMHAISIYASIHEVRTLNDTWHPQPLWPTLPSRANPQRALVELWPRTVAAEAFSTQRAVVHYLLSACADAPAAALAKQDVYGNTPLHYLAAQRCINEPLVAELQDIARAHAEAVDPWKGVRNVFGHTAEELYAEGKAARPLWGKKFMPFWQDPMPAQKFFGPWS